MFYNAKNGKIITKEYDLDYICFGKGIKPLIFIPGLGDGLKTVKGTAIPFAMLYKKYAKDYKIYVFSRRNNLNEGFNTHDMANDIISSMDELKIEKADIVGVSQGGMIAQCMAINYPSRINKLVLVVTTPRPTKELEIVINKWIDYANAKDYKSIFIDTAEKSYREEKLKKYRKHYNILSNLYKTNNFNRFLVEANACLTHNVYNELNKIVNKTLIIGASDDLVLGIEGSKELSKNIPNSELYIYDGYRHGVYEEASNFNDKIIEFLNR